jgi:hypothetical protein
MADRHESLCGTGSQDHHKGIQAVRCDLDQNSADTITVRGAIAEILQRQPAAPELLTGAADAARILTRAVAQQHPV